MERTGLPKYRVATTAALFMLGVVVAWEASGQSPTYTTIPRSNRGQSAQIGNTPIGGSRGSGGTRGTASAAARPRSSQATAPKAGAPRTMTGSMNSNKPAAGAQANKTPFSPNRAGGAQILDPNQVKSGAVGQGSGFIRPRNR